MDENNIKSEHNKMSLSEAIDTMKKLRIFLNDLELQKYVTAIDTVNEWLDKMIAFFLSSGN